MIVSAPLTKPDAPSPARRNMLVSIETLASTARQVPFRSNPNIPIARPMINIFEDTETPQMREPNSKSARKPINAY